MRRLFTGFSFSYQQWCYSPSIRVNSFFRLGSANLLRSLYRYHSTDQEKKKILFSRPLPERVAAIFLAQHLASSSKTSVAEGEPVDKSQIDEAASSEKLPMMSLSAFVEGMPSLTRDTIFQGKMDVASWIHQTKLLEMVYVEEDQQLLCTGQHAQKWSSEDQKENFRRYGPLGFVRLAMQPNELLSICEMESPDVSGSSTPSVEGDSVPALEALSTLLEIHECTRQSRWFFFNEVILLAKRVSSKYSVNHPLRYFLAAKTSDVKRLLLSSAAQAHFWVREGDRMIAHRRLGEKLAPVSPSPEPPRTRKALPINNFGGWGSAQAVPTKEDVYEILKYVPLNWGNFGSLHIPPKIKKKHIRSSFTLLWFRRQPYYFELRNMGGTTEIRRSPVLHPGHHKMTPEEARAFVERGIATGTINSLIMLGPDGLPVQQLSQTEKNLQKFFYRVCPPYFVPLQLIFQRYSKRNVSIRDMLDIAVNHPEDFEMVSAVGLESSFVRKRAGADSTRWKKAFVDDLTSRPDDIPAIGAICTYVCATWDRAEYVYVLLSPDEQCTVGGFERMVEIIGRHPKIFRLGKNFFCRVDSSDPLFCQQPEPMETEMTSRTYQRDENPYLSAKALAKVFHYIAPPHEPCTASFFVRGSSPAMRVALPSRIATILQEFPHLFACKETSPGVFSIRKLCTGKTAVREESGIGEKSAEASAVESEEDSSWLLQEDGDGAARSKAEVIDSVKQLIPPEGVDYDRLLLWASLQLQRAVNSHYGSLVKMLETESKHFALTKNEKSTLIKKIDA